VAAGGFLALLGLGIDASPATKGAREFEDAAGRATRAGEKATDAAERQTRAYERQERGAKALATALRNTAVAAIALYSATVGAALAQSTRFESALTGVGKTANLQGRELAALGEQIDRLSRTKLPNTATDLLAIAQSAGQLGVTGAENILAFTETIAMLGTASDLVGEEGATALARILNVTGESASTVKTLASVIVELGNNFAAGESQIARHTGEVARATAVYEIGSARAAAIATTLAAFGVQAELSGSAVGRAFRTIESAVKNGGDELSALASVSRASADEVRSAWEKGPIEAFKLFLSGVRETIREGGNVAAALDQVGLSGEEVLKVLPVMGKELDTLNRALGLAAEQTANATALDREFAAQMGDAKNQVALLRNEANSFVRAIGDQMLPAFVEVIQGTREWFSENRGLAESLGNIGSALLEVVGSLGPSIGSLAANLDVLAGAAAAIALTKLPAWLAAVNVQLAAMSFNPVIVGVTAAAAAILLLRSTMDGYVESSDRQIAAMVDQTSAVSDLRNAVSQAAAAGDVQGIDAKAAEARALAEEARQRVQDLETARARIVEAIEKARSRGEANTVIFLENGALKNVILDLNRATVEWGLFSQAARDANEESERAQRSNAEAAAAAKLAAEERKRQLAQEEAQRRAQQQAEQIRSAVSSLKEQILQTELLAAAQGRGAAAEAAAAREIAVRNAALQAGIKPTKDASSAVEQLAAKLFDLQQKMKEEEALEKARADAAKLVDRALKSLSDEQARQVTLTGKKIAAQLAAVNAAQLEAEHEEMLVQKRNEGAAALRDYLIEYETMRRAAAAGLTGANDAEIARINEIRDAVTSIFNSREQQAAIDAWQAKLDGVADGIGRAFGDAFAEMAYTQEFEFGRMLENMLAQFVEFLADQLALWVANQIKMAAASYATGGGGGGGINAGQVAGSIGGGGGTSMTAASAGTLAVVGIFAAAAYAWYNDRQHDYTRIESAIRDIEDVFGALSDTLGQYLPVLAGQVEVRKDGDRYRSRVGFDDGSAGYAYFDEYGDAIAAATLSGLREALGQADRFYAGPLAHLGESAKAVIAGITDEIIAMGQGGVAWLQEGLELARRLDELGMSDMERQLAELRREYDENIRKAGEYGLSLQKVGDLYQSQLSSLSDSLRARIAQYLPGYDPVGDEFDQIRRDNDAIRAAYERQREELQAHIEQVMKTIERLSSGIGGGGGSAGGGLAGAFNQIDVYMQQMMMMMSAGGPGFSSVGEQIAIIGDMFDALGTIANSGGLQPDAVARIEEQRKLLADLMRQLGEFNNGGLTDEEINAAEREARRRQNRGNRAAERSAYEDQLRAIADSALPDLVSQLKATQDQIAEVAAEAARLGVNGDLSAAALAALNQQLSEQAQDAYLSLAERMAQAIGDEQTLAELAELRWDLERAQMLIQINMLEEMGFLQADQIERLRALYNNLPDDLPAANDPGADDGPTGQGFGIDLDGLLAQYEAIQRVGSAVDALTNGSKVLDIELGALVKKIKEMDDATRQFVGNQLFLQFGDQLLAFIERYYGNTKEGDQLRIALEQVRFHLELANLNMQFQLLKSLGILTQEQIDLVEGALGIINDPANWPDFTVPATPPVSYDPGPGLDDRAAELERFFEALARWEQLGLSDARRELMDLREEFDELRATAIRLGQSVSRVDAAYQTAMADFWDRTLAPYEDRAETASDRLQAIRDHFAELIDLAGEYGGDLERILAAQQQAVADLWDEILGPLRDYQSQLIGSALSGATPEERLLAAQADFQRLADAALSGDVNAIQQLPAAIQALLQEAQSYYGTGAAYQALYSSIQSIIDQILGLGGIAGAGGVIPGDRGPVFDRPGGVDIGGLVPRIPQQPLLPQVAQASDSETVRLLRSQLEESKKQIEEQRRINREQARLLTEMVVEMRRTREETVEMKRELFALSQVQRRTNTAIEDQARTKATKRSADAA
jgi:TP901 family phage tail tape measure protein